jgi:uncharacterized protein YkwD/chitodextrinase
MKKQALIAGFHFVLLAGISRAQTIAHQVSLPPGASWCDASLINGLATQINTFRGQHGVAALAIDTLGMKDADTRAIQFAAYMETHPLNSPGFNPHTGYDTTAASLGYRLVSENLAYLTSDPAYIVYSVWQDSLHLAAMLASDAKVMGVSCMISAGGIPYWTYEPGVGSTSPPPPPPPTTGNAPALDSEEVAFLTLINNYRAQNGVGPLKVSAALRNSSLWMSTDMATKNYANHTDSLGRDPHTRMAAFNYPYSPWGENIAGGFGDAQNTFNQWQNACDADATGTCTFAHRKNMLTASFAVMGIGRAFGGSSSFGWYWTTDFGGVVDALLGTGSTPPPTIAQFSATALTITAGQSTTLVWSVAGATSLSIDNGIGNVSTVTSKSVSPAQTTTYTLTATNTGGSTTGRVTITVNPVQGGDKQAPSAPTILSAIAKSATEVDLTWSASSDNVGVTGYQIFRNGSLIKSAAAAPLSLADTTVSANTAYTYNIKAFDAAGNVSGASNTAQMSTPGVVAAPTCTPATNAFTGCYYSNTTLSGSPALSRTDSQINFSWGNGSPGPGLAPRNFSARWQGNFSFAQGTYTFSALTSDGMRLYIDNVLVMDRWRDQAATMYTVPQTLSQGNHLIVVEYYEISGGATAIVSWQKAFAPLISSFIATPSITTPGRPVTLAWSISGATSVTIDNGVGDVSGVTSKSVSPIQTTTYTLTATGPGGSSIARFMVTVNGAGDSQAPTPPVLMGSAGGATQVNLVWSASTDNVGVTGYQIFRNGSLRASVSGASRTYSDTSAAANTTYTYFVKAFDASNNLSGPSNTVTVSTPPGSSTAPASCGTPGVGVFTGCYYNNTTLSGNPVLTRTDNQINFYWANRSPDPSLQPANFSARWQGTFNFAQGNYTFTAITSDGMRIYIDGVLVLDRWRDQPPYMYLFQQQLAGGNHLVTVEYYEKSNGSAAVVTWIKN